MKDTDNIVNKSASHVTAYVAIVQGEEKEVNEVTIRKPHGKEFCVWRDVADRPPQLPRMNEVVCCALEYLVVNAHSI